MIDDAIISLDAPLIVLVLISGAITVLLAYAAGYVHGGNDADCEDDDV